LAGFQGGYDLVFEAVDEVRGVEETEGDRIEEILLLQVGNRPPDELDGIAGRDDDSNAPGQRLLLQELGLGRFP
jgi:hypothetical protein